MGVYEGMLKFTTFYSAGKIHPTVLDDKLSAVYFEILLYLYDGICNMYGAIFRYCDRSMKSTVSTEIVGLIIFYVFRLNLVCITVI